MISLKQAAEILSLTPDEVMFLHQQSILQASVNQDTLAWEFPLEKVLEYKTTRENDDEDD